MSLTDAAADVAAAAVAAAADAADDAVAADAAADNIAVTAAAKNTDALNSVKPIYHFFTSLRLHCQLRHLKKGFHWHIKPVSLIGFN